LFQEISRKDEQLQEVQEELLQQKKLTEELNQMKEDLQKASHEQKVTTQWVKSLKNSLKEYVFVNSALEIQCHDINNTLLQTFGNFSYWDKV